MTPKNKEILLSVCLIVRNEEEFLLNSIESIKDIADEIIVIDTGSSDTTINIAKKFGAIIVKKTWEYDFAKARNHYIEIARGKWILSIDADERLDPKGAAIIRNLITRKVDEICAYSFKFHNYTDKDKAVKHTIQFIARLFPNLPNLRYKGRLHEQILFTDTGLHPEIIKVDDVIIHHYGSDPRVVVSRNKYRRNEEILLRAIEEEPENWFHRFNYGFILFSEKQFIKAIEHFELAETLADKNRIKGFESTNYLYRAWVYYELRQFENAIWFCNKAIQQGDNYYDIYFTLGKAYLEAKMEKKGIEALKKAQFDGNKIPPTTRSIDEGIPRWRAANEIASYYIKIQDYEKAEYFLKKIEGYKAQDPGIFMNIFNAAIGSGDIEKAKNICLEYRTYYVDNLSYMPEYKLIDYLMENHRHEEIQTFFEKYEKIVCGMSHEMFLNIAQLYYRAQIYEKALKYYLEVFKEKEYNIGDNASLNMGTSLLKLQKYDEALNFFSGALEKNPNAPNIWNNIGVTYMEMNALENAGISFKKTIESEDGHDIARYNLARVDYFMKNYDSSLENFEYLISKKKFYVESLMFSAGILYEKGEHQKSIEKLAMIIEEQPDYLEAYDYLAKNYRKMGKTDLAEQIEKNMRLIEAHLPAGRKKA